MILFIPFSDKPFVWMDLIKLIIPVLLFFSGLLFNKLYERQKEKRRIRDLKTFLLQTIKNLIITTDKYSKEFIDTARRNKDYGINLLLIKNVSSDSYKTLQDFSRQDLYKIIIQENGIDLVHKTNLYDDLLGSINYLCKIISLVDEINPKLNGVIQDNLISWNNNLLNLTEQINLIKKFLIVNNIPHTADNILIKVLTLNINLNKFKDDKGYIQDISTVYYHFIKPAMEILTKVPADKTALDLFNTIQKGMNIFIENDNFRKQNIKYLVETARELNRKRNRLNEISQVLG